MSTSIQRLLVGQDEHDHDHDVCRGLTATLTEEDIHARAAALPGWHLRDERLHRTFRFETFDESMLFVNRLGELATDQNHHPNFSVEDKRRVHVVLWTRQMSSLTSHDFRLAAALSECYDKTSAGAA